MRKNKNFICGILIFTILIYYILGFYINNKAYAATQRQRTTSLEGLTNERYPGIAALISELKKSHPNWTFTVLYTGLDWTTVIYNETEAHHRRSLVQNSLSAWVCEKCGNNVYDNGSWYCASKAAVAYYMDVRNWLNENYIFAFETLSYDEATQTIDGVNKILSGTFMNVDKITYIDTEGNSQTIDKSYAQIIMECAKDYGISPYHLASRIKQEQGKGNSSLISGTYTGFTGYYNYFNISASGDGETTIITNGLTYARSKGWTSPELAIRGGAQFLVEDYIGNYQDCLYLEKYQVDSAGGLYSHQYMQNISAPYSEGASTYSAYKGMGLVDCGFNFIIPVYENMPTAISPRPGAVTMEIVTENVKVTTAYSDLKIRENTSSSGLEKAYAKKGTVLLRIEKATVISEDGRYWDKVVYVKDTEVVVGYAARTDTDGSVYLTVVDDVTTVNEEMQTSTDVNVRNGPGLTGTTVKQTLSKNVKVTVIDKISYKINGSYWYRIKLTDGTQGYVASEYLKKTGEATPEEPPKDPEVKLDNCKIDEDKLIIAPGTTLDKIEGATLEGNVFGTGAKITVKGTTYIVTIKGDTNGDGIINSADLLKVVKHLTGASTLDGAYLKASDCNGDGTINSADLLKIVKHLNGTSQITL